MPCYDDRGRDDCAQCQDRLDRATRAACELANALWFEPDAIVSTETKKWVEEHRKADAERKEKSH